MKVIYLIIIPFLFISARAGDYVKKRNLELAGNGIEELEIDCGAGFLKINGDSDSDVIHVEAEIILHRVDEDRAEKMIDNNLRLEIKKRGDRAELVCEFDRSNSFFSVIFGDDVQAAVNLTVRIPEKIDLDIDDGSGFMEISEINGDLLIDDGSGEITVDEIRGRIEIDDGSGEISVSNTDGNVEIDDGSGEINIDKISGDVIIDDGSGTLQVTDVGGNVEIRDGSGSININGVDKDVWIRDAGSGGVRINNVKGFVHQKED